MFEYACKKHLRNLRFDCDCLCVSNSSPLSEVMNSDLRGPRGYLSLKEKASSSTSFLSGRCQGTAPSSSRELCTKPGHGRATATRTHGLCTFLAETKRKVSSSRDFDPFRPILRCPSCCETKVLDSAKQQRHHQFVPSHPTPNNL